MDYKNKINDMLKIQRKADELKDFIDELVNGRYDESTRHDVLELIDFNFSNSKIIDVEKYITKGAESEVGFPNTDPHWTTLVSFQNGFQLKVIIRTRMCENSPKEVVVNSMWRNADEKCFHHESAVGGFYLGDVVLNGRLQKLADRIIIAAQDIHGYERETTTYEQKLENFIERNK